MTPEDEHYYTKNEWWLYMTPEHQRWVKMTKVRDKTWIHDNVIRVNRYADMNDIITAVGKELGMRIPHTLPNPHELYKWLDTHEERSY